ncbi:hypothetical protein Pfo_010876 [Paulownia fortunei]|nr:hypothetical protein Pfo_010876 [Paulownia fortunei]
MYYHKITFESLCYSGLKWKQKEFLKLNKRKVQFLWIVKSVLNNCKSLSISDNGTTEPARILLERLFAQTQTLEEQMGRDPRLPRAAENGVNLGVLELDLQAALEALKKKEEDLLDAERKILLKQEKLEEELSLANMDLASLAKKNGDLKLHLKERDWEISAAQSALSLKEEEIVKMKNEWVKKSEEAASAESEIRCKAKLLDETNKIVEKQQYELQQLQRAIQKKEEELEISISMQKNEAQKLKAAEVNLEKQTMDWLVTQEELEKLAEEISKNVGEANEISKHVGEANEISKHIGEANETVAELGRRMEGQEKLLEKQVTELEDQRYSVMSCMMSLRDDKLEVESERVKLRVAEAQNKELERHLSIEEELVGELQKELDKERSSLKQAIGEMSALQDELEHKSAEFEEMQALLQAKESELAEARLEIQHLKSEQALLQLILEENDLELSGANKMLEEVNQEIAKIKEILFSRENELIQALSILEKKDEHVQTLQCELNDARVKLSEAETVVERIVDLTKEVVLSFSDEGYYALSPVEQTNDKLSPLLLDRPADRFRWQKKQLEAELEITRESLRTKEMEVLAAQRALTIKDEEIKMVLGKLDAREKEMTNLKGEMMRDGEDLKQVYALAQERIGEKSAGDFAIEKLLLEAAQLEFEAATSALHKITEMSLELLNKSGLSIEADHNTNLYEQNGSETRINMTKDTECSGELKSEVSRLLAFTEKLVREAGIAGQTSQF